MAFKNLKVSASEKVANGQAWFSCLLALTGGFTATGTFVGKFIGHTIHGLPLWINLPVAAWTAYMFFADLLDDGVPDRLRTIYIAIFWPSWLLGAQGKGSHYVNGWISDLNHKIDKNVGPWVADNPSRHSTAILMTTISLVCIVLALYHAHRYYSKNHGAASTVSPAVGGGVPVIGNRKQRR